MLETGNRIKELRESLGYSIDEFARLIGVHRSSMYRYEGTDKIPQRELPMSIAILISEKFNVSLDWLAGTSDNRYKEQSTSKLTEIYEELSDEHKKELFNYAMYLKNKEVK